MFWMIVLQLEDNQLIVLQIRELGNNQLLKRRVLIEYEKKQINNQKSELEVLRIQLEVLPFFPCEGLIIYR